MIKFHLDEKRCLQKKGGGGIQVYYCFVKFRSTNILICTFCECADGFQDLSKAFYYPIQLLTFNLLL
jgi:hypothetical protein